MTEGSGGKLVKVRQGVEVNFNLSTLVTQLNDLTTNLIGRKPMQESREVHASLWPSEV